MAMPTPEASSTFPMAQCLSRKPPCVSSLRSASSALTSASSAWPLADRAAPSSDGASRARASFRSLISAPISRVLRHWRPVYPA